MIDGLERDLVSFVAAHEFVTAEQSAALLQVTQSAAADLIERLRTEQLVSRVELSSSVPAAYRITQDGTELIDSALPPLRALSWARYRHEIALGWLWASARHGNLGDISDALSRRQMQCADSSQRSQLLLETPGAAFSDQAAEPSTDARVAYPDLALVQTSGGWVSLNVVLTAPEPGRLRTMIGRLSRDPAMRAQLYLVANGGHVAHAINTTAADLGVASRVHVQLLAKDGIAGA
jgi:hypothetical protein